MAKVALLIGVSDYEPGLNPLPAAVRDVAAVQQVLTHPDMGGFAAAEIRVLQNPDRQTMEDAIYRLFTNRQKDDLVLLYFSGHGVIDDNGEFYFASRTTCKDDGKLRPTTAVAARSVQGWMEQSRSQRQVIILDSCFSGAFAKGVKAKNSGSVNVEQFLGGKGRAILTASTSTQYALAQDGMELSVYTHYLVEGIRTGGADLDDDGWISVEELHDYTRDKVREAAPAMTPEFYPVKEGYKIRLAKSPQDDPQLKYRKEVKLLAAEDEGEFSPVNRIYLDELRRNLDLSSEIVTMIETEELEPYRQRREKVEQYRSAFAGMLAHRYPLLDRDRVALQRLQQLLSLRDEDIATIEAPLLAPKQAEYERQQAERKKQAQAQAAARQVKQPRKLERQQRQTAQVKPPRPPSAAPTTPPQPVAQTFEFKTARLTIIQKQGFFGSTTAVEIKHSRGSAQYFVEELGNGITLEMIKIPAGTFLMGSPQGEGYDFEKPQHSVTVPAFWMGKFAVTQAQWSQVARFRKVKQHLNSDPANFSVNRPVEQVSWHDAVEFCQRLSHKTGKSYRLPSEAEWEYACRAGTTTPFHFGETITTDLVNYDGNYTYGNAPKGKYRQQTTEVGSFPPNGFGLYDMHGNVWEWCADHWHGDYQGTPADGSAWLSEDKYSAMVLRGGSWDDNPRYCRSAYRSRDYAGNRSSYYGFRLACSSPRTL
jgi:formylglycine-generating enzyme required for sulfatase activity